MKNFVLFSFTHLLFLDRINVRPFFRICHSQCERLCCRCVFDIAILACLRTCPQFAYVDLEDSTNFHLIKFTIQFRVLNSSSFLNCSGCNLHIIIFNLYRCVWWLNFAWKNWWFSSSLSFYHISRIQREINEMHWKSSVIESTSFEQPKRSDTAAKNQIFIVIGRVHVCNLICVYVCRKLSHSLDYVRVCVCVLYTALSVFAHDVWFERMKNRVDKESEILCIRVA